eukprot:scaffold9422_cov129-Skeletonema_marinoi.AAC.1
MTQAVFGVPKRSPVSSSSRYLQKSAIRSSKLRADICNNNDFAAAAATLQFMMFNSIHIYAILQLISSQDWETFRSAILSRPLCFGYCQTRSLRVLNYTE